MTFLAPRGNDALNVNPPNADRHLTQNGSNWLWAVTALFGLTFLAWLFWTLSLRRTTTASTYNNTTTSGVARTEEAKHGHHGTAATAANGLANRGERIFHYLLTAAAFVGLIAYFTMASDLGSTPVSQYMNIYDDDSGTNQPLRQVFWVRYIYWFISWALILIAVLILSGLSWATILFSVTMLEIWVVSWLAGAMTHSSYRWGYFVFGLVAELVLAYILLAWGASSSRGLMGGKTSYTMLAALLVAVWLVYPISWGLSEGGNRLSVTGEMVFYGILDIISVPILGSLLLVLSRRFDHAGLFAFTQRGRVAGAGMHGEGYGMGPTNGHHVTSGHHVAGGHHDAAVMQDTV
jgi:bacteriorhodopsin